MIGQDDFIVDLLVSRGILTEAQVNTAKEYQAKAGLESLMDAIYALKGVTESDVVQLLASEYEIDSYDFSSNKKKLPESVITMLPGQIVRRFRLMPIAFSNGTLRVAMSDPADVDSLDAIRHLLKMDVEAVVASKRQIDDAIDLYYSKDKDEANDLMNDITQATITGTIGATSGATTDATTDGGAGDGEEEEDENVPLIRYANLLIIEAFRLRASDIHLEPMEKKFQVRYRIDGVLNVMESPPKFLQNKIISRLKVMASLDLSEQRIPQDGRIRITAMGRDLDLRVSTIPTVHGESIVMRILDKSGVMLGIPELGFFQDDQDLIMKLLNLPDGIFLVTGPTGSGKTTSLYSFLHALNQPVRKIITAEDPVEYELSGINQVQIQSEIGMTFVAALRAMLRQAPNVIMVGEIRDRETGEIAINAALTGHLVFSTLHTNDAPSAITRLIDMGVKPFLIASSVRAIMAQRLVRRLCKHCKKPYTPSELECKQMEITDEMLKTATYMTTEGCPECNHGYRGRMGIYEIFVLDPSIEKLIFNKCDASVIGKYAVDNLGMRTLRFDGMRKAAAGSTTLKEVLRLTVAAVE